MSEHQHDTDHAYMNRIRIDSNVGSRENKSDKNKSNIWETRVIFCDKDQNRGREDGVDGSHDKGYNTLIKIDKTVHPKQEMVEKESMRKI